MAHVKGFTVPTLPDAPAVYNQTYFDNYSRVLRLYFNRVNQFLNTDAAEDEVIIEDEGTPVTTRQIIDFVGAGVTVTDTGAKTQISIPGGGGGGTWTEAEIDFGAVPVWDSSFVIVDAAVTGTSKIVVSPSGNPPSGRHADDWQWDSIGFAAVAGSGSFTLYANANGPVEGKRNIYYQVV